MRGPWPPLGPIVATPVVGVLSKLKKTSVSSLPNERFMRIEKTLSPMKKAKLRSTCMKQLSELRQLHDNRVLTEDEYEEQREELVKNKLGQGVATNMPTCILLPGHN